MESIKQQIMKIVKWSTWKLYFVKVVDLFHCWLLEFWHKKFHFCSKYRPQISFFHSPRFLLIGIYLSYRSASYTYCLDLHLCVYSHVPTYIHALLCIHKCVLFVIQGLCLCLDFQFDTVVRDRPIILSKLLLLHFLKKDIPALSWEFFVNRFETLSLEAQLHLDCNKEFPFPTSA